MTTDRPEETEAQRADRNFGDLLQEVRVAQTGVQILFAFLLTIPLQARFPTLNAYQQDVFVVALLCTALSTCFFIAPVAYHRVLFRQRMKDHIVRAASRMAMVGLLFVALAVVLAVHLVLDLVLNLTIAWAVGGALALLLLFFWFLLPYSRLRANRREQAAEEAASA